MQRKTLKVVTLVLTTLFLITGCGALSNKGQSLSLYGKGSPSTVTAYNPDTVKTVAYTKTDNKTYKFLNVQANLPSPQSYFMFEKGLLEESMRPTGYKTIEILDDSMEKIEPNLDKGYYDFAYVPLGYLIRSWNGQSVNNSSKGALGEKYKIIAFSYRGGSSLLTAPEIFDIKDLGGKTIGITCEDAGLESSLNSIIEPAGLKTKIAGGNVEIKYDSVKNLMNALLQKEISAVLCSDNRKSTFQSLGFQTAYFWPKGSFANEVLIARKEIIEGRPEIVKAVLDAHTQSTKLALQDLSFTQGAIAKYNQYYSSLGRTQKDKLSYDNIIASYDIDQDYLAGVLDYLKKANYIKGNLSFNDIADTKSLNQVLRDQGIQ